MNDEKEIVFYTAASARWQKGLTDNLALAINLTAASVSKKING